MQHQLTHRARKRRFPLAAALAAPALAFAVALPAAAQTSGGTGISPATGTPRYSFFPYTSDGYVGINVGRPKYDTPCGVASAFTCDDPNTGLRVYAGGLFNRWAGFELGYVDFGKAEAGGGDTRARGINFTLVGRAPLADTLSGFAKLGTTYGRTRVSAAPASGLVTGRESDWGLSYGVGLSFDFHRNWSAIAEWERHNFEFARGIEEPVKMVSLGLRYRF